MSQYLFRRILQMFLSLAIVSLITFAFMRAIPGNPFDTGKGVPERVQQQLEAKYNLDDPIHWQYLHYMGDVIIPQVTENELPQTFENDYLINIYVPVVDQTLPHRHPGRHSRTGTGRWSCPR